MFEIIYIADSAKHFEQAIKEYEKRLSGKLKLTKLKPSKNGTMEQIKLKDTENINKILLKKAGFNVLLSLDGEELDTIGFSKLLEKKLNKGEKINFVIGGAFGLVEEKLKNIHYKLKLSKLTFPHSLALLILLEQIYRSLQIINGRKYHY